MNGPGIGITLGDPGGIGPEIVVKSLLGNPLPDVRIVVFGDSTTLGTACRQLRVDLPLLPWRPEEAAKSGLYLRDIPLSGARAAENSPNSDSGRGSFDFFEKAVQEAIEGHLAGLVTAPVSKASWRLAGLPWRGHTEYLEHRFPRTIMSFWSERLKVALFSHHLALREALDRIRRDRLIHFFRSLHGSLSELGLGDVELLVSGLNPHGGEAGVLGTEEESEVRPAVEEARAEGIRISGPYPPDTIFLRARDNPQTMVVALYHDQGLIAFKLLGFETGVNLSLGLPFIRTSPDHGTAFDIAGRGIADPRSMIEALKLARFLISASS